MNLTKFFIDQHGCAKNQTDGELIVGYLVKEGFSYTQDPDQADFIIVNSCGFIASAKKESIDAVYSIKNQYPNAKIIMTGCLAQRYAQMLYDSMPELDGIFGNGDLSKIVKFMHSLEKEGRSVKLSKQEGVCGGERPLLFNFPGSAYVKVTEGCSNHCSFCAIPLIRGELRSRPVTEVIKEIKALVSSGVYEINLIGQDLAAYGTEESYVCQLPEGSRGLIGHSGLAQLLAEISKLEGDFIVRILYIHPDHFNADILPVMKKDKRFLPYFDIPFQSGDDQIILSMNRTGSAQNYKDLVSTIRQEFPQAVLRTTFLTGFPGESDQAAKNTCEFLREIKPDWSGCFPYSREEDTPSYDFKHRVSEKLAKKRAEELEKIQSEITVKNLEKYIGKDYNVLIEEVIEPGSDNGDSDSTESEGLAIGRAWFQAPDVDGAVVIRYDLEEKDQVDAIKAGNIVSVRILASTGLDLDGRFIKLVKVIKQNSNLRFIY